MRETPTAWRRAWQLHRSIPGTDSRGDPIRTYNMEEPDYTGVAGTESGVCWQISNSDNEVQTYGERPSATASFVLYGDLPISVFDRCVFSGGTWEVTAVDQWPHHRYVKLKEVV